MQYYFFILIFLFGAALGSFISVIANRYNTGLSFFKGRSICFSCSHELRNKDLFPIFSFIFLRGRCRYCQSKIPKETLVIEILMGVLSVLAFFKSGLSGPNLSWVLATNYLLLTFIFAIILLISIYDLRHFIIPDSFLVALFIFSLIYILIFNLSIFQSFLAGIVLALPFFLIFLISKGAWFGLGDVKYILVLGLLLGFGLGLSAIVLSFWIGAALSFLAFLLRYLLPHIRLPLLSNNFTIKSEIPFGPFLSLGIVISLLLRLDIFNIHELFNIL